MTSVLSPSCESVAVTPRVFAMQAIPLRANWQASAVPTVPEPTMEQAMPSSFK